ncbi:uncharacterized protein [Procambarus clarkii]|uniref:uncharacterized protein n=1 Tax=Procambarus clarkii TaxID=6728 RepID=UPI0037447C71
MSLRELRSMVWVVVVVMGTVLGVRCLVLSYIDVDVRPVTYGEPPRNSPHKHHQSCRSLFTITDAFQYNHKVNNSSETGGLGSLSEGWGTSEEPLRINSETVGRVRRLVRKRESPSGASTPDYYSIARLLPKLLFLGQPDPNTDAGSTGEIERQTPIREERRKKRRPPYFLRRSRITGGVLPHVSCRIALYERPSIFAACIRKRVERKPKLWLHFMGDSKIRMLFDNLLNRTDSVYHYMVKHHEANHHLQDMDEPWSEMVKRWNHRDIRYRDMEVTTRLQPQLLLTYSFRDFNQPHWAYYDQTKELQELDAWASGSAPVPDLLVLGYGSWLMQITELTMRDSQNFPHDILDLLLTMHQKVVPLLEKISERCRVLVVPQSRMRPHSDYKMNFLAAFNPAYFDWSEKTFLYLQSQYRTSWGSTTARSAAVAAASYRVIEAARSHATAAALSSYSNGRDNGTATSPPWGSKDSSAPQETKLAETKWQDTSDPMADMVQTETQPHITASPNYPKPHKLPYVTTTQRELSGDYLDHLDPIQTSSSGLWWWDSSLPLNLAAILECDELYQQGYTWSGLYADPQLHCRDGQHPDILSLSDMTTMLMNLMCNSLLQQHEPALCCG